MSKSLKALERIKKFYPQWHLYNRNDFLIIETEIKDYEKTDDQIYDLFEKFGINNRKDLLKKLKALEIIEEKSVDIQLLKDSKNNNDYNWCVHTKDRALTQEEYEKIKIGIIF